MNQVENLLVTLMEECDEVSQRCSKALRFGLGEVQPGQALTNAERICCEVLDLYAIVEMLEEQRILNPRTFLEADGLMEVKKAKVKKFQAYSRSLGTLTTELGTDLGGVVKDWGEGMRLDDRATFEKVREHLRRQKVRAFDGHGCRYRDDEGRRCAVGCLIADEHYSEAFEGAAIVDDPYCSSNWSQDRDKVLAVCAAVRASGCDASWPLLNALQQVHDSYPEKWEEHLAYVEARFFPGGAK